MTDTLPDHEELAQTFIHEFERLEPVSTLESDRFCDVCGYNLRTSPVRRDPRSNILMVRCAECARFHPVAIAESAWVKSWNRIALFMIFVWIGIIGGCIVLTVILEGAIQIETVETLGRRHYIRDPLTGSYRQTGAPLYAQSKDRHFWELIIAMTLGSLAVSFVSCILATVFLPHWRRWHYHLYAWLLPVGTAAFIYLVMHFEPSERFQGGWYQPYLIGLTMLQVLGGTFGVAVGRPLARLIARILLPPKLRNRVVYLWHVDKLNPPVA